MHGDFPTIVGSIGVGLLLLAFLLNLIKRVSQDSRIYTTLNVVGAGLACYSSYLISFIPFIILGRSMVCSFGDCADQTSCSLAFRRQGLIIRTDRLKAGLQTVFH